jgi:hypothetical protein
MAEPSSLAHLLAWPKKLEDFSFGRIVWNPEHWDLETFEQLLEPYRSSLKNISIGHLPTGGQKTINFTSFNELSTLTLTRTQLDCTPEVANATLLAPKLHTFTLDFGRYDTRSEEWANFGQEQVEWLLKFAELAAAQKSALKTIAIVFNPDEWSAPSSREGFEAVGYPWDRMDDLRVKMRPLGIDFKYSPMPIYTKEEVKSKIEQYVAYLESLNRQDVIDFEGRMDDSP